MTGEQDRNDGYYDNNGVFRSYEFGDPKPAEATPNHDPLADPSPVRDYEETGLPAGRSTPSPVDPSETVQRNPSEEVKPSDPLENEAMIKEFLANITDKLVNASSLAKEVGKLRDQVKAMGESMSFLRSERDQALASKGQAERERDLAKADLAECEAWAKECEGEIEKVTAERNETRGAYSSAQHDVEYWKNLTKQAESRLDAVMHEHDEKTSQAATEIAHLRESNARLESKIANMVRALQA